MTDSEKLARWQGARDCRGSKNNKSKWKWPTSYNPNLFYYKALPDYLNDDAAAMGLLDTLVEKGCRPELYYGSDDGVYSWYCCINKNRYDDYHIKPTRRAAVVAAVLELIAKEDV